jgi:hypothetical protein
MIFLRIPKTASTSISFQILNSLELQQGDFSTRCAHIAPRGFEQIKSENHALNMFATDEHPSLSSLNNLGIIRTDDLSSYKIYGVLRNPVDRFFSIFTHLFSTSLFASEYEVAKMTKEQIAEEAFKILDSAERNGTRYIYFHPKKNGGYPMYPQTNWLLHNVDVINNVIIYPNFNQLLLDFTGSEKLEFREKVKIKTPESSISESIVREIQKWYFGDFKLWEHFSEAI